MLQRKSELSRRAILSIIVQVPQFLMHLTAQHREIEVKGATVRECLKDLVRRYPEVKPLVFARNGRLLRTMDIYINGQSAFPGELAKPVTDGDFLQVVNIVFGG